MTTRDPARRVTELLPVFEGESVLCLPCGDGSFAFAYAGNARAVVALDTREEMLKKAQKTREELGFANVHFRKVSDTGNLGLPAQSFDLVVVNRLSHLSDALDTLDEARGQVRRLLVWAEPVGPEGLNHRNFLDTLLSERHGSAIKSFSESDMVSMAEERGWVIETRQAMRHLQDFREWTQHLDRETRDQLRDDLIDDMEANDAGLFPHFSQRRLCFLERWVTLGLVREQR